VQPPKQGIIRTDGKFIMNSSANRQVSQVFSASSWDHLLSADADFPPPCEMLSPELEIRIIQDFCKDQAPASLEEAGCSVCGQLMSQCDFVPLKSIKDLLHILEEPGVLYEECRDATEKICECTMVCAKCRQSIRKNVVPRLALCRIL